MINLFQHQKEGIAFLKKTRKAILADSMGVGKTRQAIVAAGEVSDGSVLVICPASLKINWEREIHMVYPEDGVEILEKPLYSIGKSWYIVNYDQLHKHEWIINSLNLGEIETVIIDEAHYAKGQKTIRAKKTMAIAEKAHRVYLLTGTPIMNRPAEIYNLLKMVDHPVAAKRTAFMKRYCGAYLKTIFRKDGRVIRFMDETGATNLPELRETIKSVFLRREKKDVLDLPEKIISVQVVKLDSEWQKKYDGAWEAYLEWVADNPEGKDIENILTAQHLVELTKLKQVCSQAKCDQIEEDVLNSIDQGEKVIIFSQYTETINILNERLSEKTGVATLTGSDDQEDRQRAVDDFQNLDTCKVFIANMKAGGVGITLTAASIVIFADMDWSPAVHDQSADRAHRIGQTGTVNVYYYVCKDTIEEDIVAILDQKREIIKDVMEGSEEASRESIGAQFIKRLKDRMS